MSYSIETLQSDCYEGTSCLINKFDIKDEVILKELETTITLNKITEYLKDIFKYVIKNKTAKQIKLNSLIFCVISTMIFGNSRGRC